MFKKNKLPGWAFLPVLKHTAFSLVEMLMALLVASLLLAALAPVMTRKLGDKITFEGTIPASKHKVVYLTEPGEGEWTVPDGIRNFKVTTVGAGGGGGAGSNYGCVVFTTTATQQNALLGEDARYCEHVRSDSNASFTIPEGVNEIYVSMISGAGGGGGGSAVQPPESPILYNKAGTYHWEPKERRGDRILVSLSGAGGGGGGADQGGAGGGAGGGMINGAIYDINQSKTSIEIIIGEGGKGGYYRGTPGAGGKGWRNGEDGVINTPGGGGGGSTGFDNGIISAYGGGGGSGTGGFLAGGISAVSGWYDIGNISGDTLLWKKVFNLGAHGRAGGISGTYVFNGNIYGGKSGGDGGAGGGTGCGANGENGTIGEATIVGGNNMLTGEARGGRGGVGGYTVCGEGNGGWGQDFCADCAGTKDGVLYGGGAGGGGGGSAWSDGQSALVGCDIHSSANGSSYVLTGNGGGGAGASCGWNVGGNLSGGNGGDGLAYIHYLKHVYGGTGGNAGVVVPRTHLGSKRGMGNSIKPGNVLTVVPGRGGKGGDRVIIYRTGGDNQLRTINRSGIINESDITLSDANGQPGTASYIKFGEELLATTGDGSCAGGYTTDRITNVKICTNGVDCGTRRADGNCGIDVGGWHGHQSAACGGDFLGTAIGGGSGTMLVWNGTGMCGPLGGKLVEGNFQARDGMDGSAGFGGGGAYYGGYGGKGGDGYIKIEWGIPRNLDKTDATRYSGGGGSAGETVIKRITVPNTTHKIRYRIGEGGLGASYNDAGMYMNNGGAGGDTVFGLNQSYAVTAKGGKGGNSVFIDSIWGDSYFNIISFNATHGFGGVAECNIKENCNEDMNGKIGEHNKGGQGGKSSTGNGARGGGANRIDGEDADNLNPNGTAGGGGGGGGGGGTSGAGIYGRGGKGANGYIKIEYED